MLLINLHSNIQGTGNGTAHAPTPGTGSRIISGSGIRSGSGSGSRHKIALENMFTPPSEREIKALFDGLAVLEDDRNAGNGCGRGHSQSGGSLNRSSQSPSQSHGVKGVNGIKWDMNGTDERWAMEKNYESSVKCEEPAESYTDIESGSQPKKGDISTYFWNFKSYLSRTKKSAKVSFSYNTKGNSLPD
jgi:hypothetical protein